MLKRNGEFAGNAGNKLASIMSLAMIFILSPIVITFLINGSSQKRNSDIKDIDTGKNVIIHIDGKNKLIDVEEYILGVMPKVTSGACSQKILDAQAVAVRTKIYYAMGSESIIDSKDLDYEYMTEDEQRQALGDKYDISVRRFKQAIFNTVGISMK